MKYTEAELDYVINKLELGFMRHSIKNHAGGVDWLMNSFGAHTALVQYRFIKMCKDIWNALKGGRRNV